MNSINVIDSSWSAMAQALKQQQDLNKKPMTIH
jgi:hypothetical protein